MKMINCNKKSYKYQLNQILLKNNYNYNKINAKMIQIRYLILMYKYQNWKPTNKFK